MLKRFISTGYYVNDCGNGQPVITGIAVYTGYLNQCDSDGKAYYAAIEVARQLRLLSPCVSPATTTTTTTTTTTAPASQSPLQASGYIGPDWTGYFVGEGHAYYDVVSWGNTEGYLSGHKFNTDYYFSQISINDSKGEGTLLAVVKTSGVLRGFGSNVFNQLDIPSGLTNVQQVSVGYDHVLALKNDGTVTGWGRDYWNALSFNSGKTNVVKVCAGLGGSVFLLSSGRITGTNLLGGTQISYPTGTGYKNVDYYYDHVLTINKDGIVTGFGSNGFGQSNRKDISGVSYVGAGMSTSMVIRDGGYASGYGTNQAINYTPNVSNSGIKIELKALLGTILKRDQNIEQWVEPYPGNAAYMNRPSYLQNNIVDISQGASCTAAIFKRYTNSGSLPITGYSYLWRVSFVGGAPSYGGISIGDVYPPSSIIYQPCDNYSFSLPAISYEGQTYTQSNVPNCNNYGGYHQIIFGAIKISPMMNVNYTKTGVAPKTGWAATGVTFNDYWNPMLYTDTGLKLLYYSDGSLSTISGGVLSSGATSGVNWSHSDSMYASFVSGISGNTFSVKFDHFPAGGYRVFVYGHGPLSGQKSLFDIYLNGALIAKTGTTTGANYNSTSYIEGTQYVSRIFDVANTGSNITILTSGFLNGVQFVKLA